MSSLVLQSALGPRPHARIRRKQIAVSKMSEFVWLALIKAQRSKHLNCKFSAPSIQSMVKVPYYCYFDVSHKKNKVWFLKICCQYAKREINNAVWHLVCSVCASPLTTGFSLSPGNSVYLLPTPEVNLILNYVALSYRLVPLLHFFRAKQPPAWAVCHLYK